MKSFPTLVGLSDFPELFLPCRAGRTMTEIEMANVGNSPLGKGADTLFRALEEYFDNFGFYYILKHVYRNIYVEGWTTEGFLYIGR